MQTAVTIFLIVLGIGLLLVIAVFVAMIGSEFKRPSGGGDGAQQRRGDGSRSKR